MNINQTAYAFLKNIIFVDNFLVLSFNTRKTQQTQYTYSFEIEPIYSFKSVKVC